ncbi:hypothetical protein [Faecalibaculum rodentium]|jgi:hypothetical protein|uniref:hypothetical protein n=1 Tax=Faecalibaculum rodentium TaxID=1702221 RepID=UPI0015BD0812|nr:hypothetical protein [Faecalibaculum rodentium]
MEKSEVSRRIFTGNRLRVTGSETALHHVPQMILPACLHDSGKTAEGRLPVYGGCAGS